MSKDDLLKKFKAAVDFIQKLPSDGPYQSSNEEKLQFYALFKQASSGPNNTKAPSRLNIVGKMKWDAWKKLGNISKDEAMKKYIQIVLDVTKKMPGKESESLKKQLEGYVTFYIFTNY